MRTLIVGLSLFILAACGAEQGKAQAPGGESGAQAQAAAGDAEPPRDLLTLAEGAVVVSASANSHDAHALTDGDPETRWSNGGPRFPGPHVFVFELRAPTQLTRVGIDNSGPRPAGVAGGSAGAIRVEASAQGPDAGFAEIGVINAAADGETLIEVAVAAPVRWLRFTITSTQDPSATWTYFDEVIAHGAQTPPTETDRFTGVFNVGRTDLIELKQDRASISGCYVEAAGHARGEISGDVIDGVARLAWRRIDADRVGGVATLTIDSRGQINGVRYRDRSRTVWAGPRAPAGTTTQCSAEQPPENPIADALANEGEARIYGILFDFDQATIKSSSEPALRQLLAALEANASMNVDIEGHTDNVGDDAYNLALSERRAQSVVAWLTQNGVAAARLTAVGKGETVPVADNATADGRALNRRVEVRRR